MKIGIFGGSFDPIHNIHLEIMKVAKKQLQLDLILIVPTSNSPLKKRKITTSNEQRLAMIALVTNKYQWIKIETCELERTGLSYTIDTINYLKIKYQTQDPQFYLIIGGDQFLKLEQWKNSIEISKNITWVVARREDYHFKTNNPFDNVIFLKKIFKNISATKIRTGYELEYINKKVNNFINNNLLYLEERLGTQVDKTRYQHCLNVGEMAEKLAINYKINPLKAKIAGTYHDITKQWTKSQHQQYLIKYDPEHLLEPLPTWHAVTGMLYLKHQLLVNDQKILNAILNHTTPAIKMTKFDKIIFIADKISKERTYHQVEYFRQLAFKNLNKTFIELLSYQYHDIVKKNTDIGKKLVQAYNYFIKK